MPDELFVIPPQGREVVGDAFVDAGTATRAMKDRGASAVIRYIRAPDSAPNGLADDDLRKLWRKAGGSFHGPNIETGTMPESKLLPFLRSTLRNQPGGAVPREPTAAMIEIGAAEIPPLYDGSEMAELAAKDVWIAMHDAATKAGEGET